MYKYRLTVFTPTYNRGYIIHHLYESLKRQKFKDFEWIVIDDGSTDNTEELFSKWCNEKNFFEITYIRKQNGGKHRAINNGVEIAKGELFFIVDSDDYLVDDALEMINQGELSILPNIKNTFAGVCFNKGYSKEKIIGTTFQDEILDITMLQREEYGITGDKAETFYTDILKKYPFPEFKGENFITECVVWDKIANDGYKLRFFNEIVYLADYLADGLTKQGNSIFIKNPKGYALYINQTINFKKLNSHEKIKKYEIYYNHLKGVLSDKEIAKNLTINLLIVKFVKYKLVIINYINELCTYKDFYIENKNSYSIEQVAIKLNISRLKLRIILFISKMRKAINR